MQTWKDYELAAVERLWDGLCAGIGRNGGTTGAVYLFGYIAEMCMKSAYFRASGVPATSPVNGLLPQLRMAASAATGSRVYARSSFHDLDMLCHALVHVRRSVGRPLPPTVELDLRTHTAMASRRWSTDLRYSPAVIPEADANEGLRAAEWFLDNYVQLV